MKRSDLLFGALAVAIFALAWLMNRDIPAVPQAAPKAVTKSVQPPAVPSRESPKRVTVTSDGLTTFIERPTPPATTSTTQP